MFHSVKQFLEAIPATDRDSKVVTMPGLDEDAMPPAMKAAWVDCRRLMREIDGLETAKSREAAAFASTQAMFENVMRRAEQEIETRRAKLVEEQERVIMMIANIGIKIEDGQ